MKPGDPLINDVAQLLRLRQLRAEAARVERDAARARRDEAQQAAQEREALVRRLCSERDALDVRVAASAAAMALLAPYASARREVLVDALERAEYAFIDDKEKLSRAQAALDAAHTAWQKASARCEAVEQLDVSTRRSAARAANERAEREIDAAPAMAFRGAA